MMPAANEPTLPVAAPDARDPAGEPGQPTGGRYRILEPHARGGLGEVFVAEDTELRREVALKEIQARLAHDPVSRRRFLREAEVTGQLEHPGIVPVYGLGSYPDGRPFYAMRFIRGETLHEAIARYHQSGSGTERRVAFRDLLSRFVAVCNAVAYAHSKGVIHRDIKPSNVMLGPFGETLLVDWGLAKQLRIGECGTRSEDQVAEPEPAHGQETLVQSAIRDPQSAMTSAGSVVGTPAYMSPEQADGDIDALGPPADVYSLGATLYVILTGKPPFEGSDPAGTLRRVRAGGLPPPRSVNPAVPAALDAVCRKAMARAPADRYAGARELAAEVEHWLADEPVTAHREPWSARARRWGRRHRTLVAGAAAALAVSALAASVATVFLSRAYDRERGAKSAAERNERQAEAQRDLARRNFRRARETVDRLLTRAGENLADTPQAEELRRKLLEDALEFQEQFLSDDESDPVTREEAAASAERVGVINWRLGRADDAEKAYRLAIDRYERLAADFPDEPRFGRERVTNYNYLGTLLYGVGVDAEADALLVLAMALHD
jgi:serine/threonine-protein kinase